MKKQPWIQAAIDVEDIELAKRIAFMALDAGAEWLEVGTPLLYRYGHAAIGMLRKAVGKQAVLVADYKCPFAGLCASQAAREGIDYVMLTAGYSDWAIEHSIAFAKETGVTPIFDLSVRHDDMRLRAAQLRDMGATHLFTRHYSQHRSADGLAVQTDNISAILQEQGFLLGITSDDLTEAQDAVRTGADWITFGWVLREPNQETCKLWIDTIHRARG